MVQQGSHANEGPQPYCAADQNDWDDQLWPEPLWRGHRAGTPRPLAFRSAVSHLVAARRLRMKISGLSAVQASKRVSPDAHHPPGLATMHGLAAAVDEVSFRKPQS
mmetsp:Transcript_15121/g.48127  ORF Transcript_15121/g.48127 Transcript_15121/m.48127 type:complete len:106 (+) Transcript_15121:1279-1596(+)